MVVDGRGESRDRGEGSVSVSKVRVCAATRLVYNDRWLVIIGGNLNGVVCFQTGLLQRASRRIGELTSRTWRRFLIELLILALTERHNLTPLANRYESVISCQSHIIVHTNYVLGFLLQI